jgi:hypothetical protein
MVFFWRHSIHFGVLIAIVEPENFTRHFVEIGRSRVDVMKVVITTKGIFEGTFVEGAALASA